MTGMLRLRASHVLLDVTRVQGLRNASHAVLVLLTSIRTQPQHASPAEWASTLLQMQRAVRPVLLDKPTLTRMRVPRAWIALPGISHRPRLSFVYTALLDTSTMTQTRLQPATVMMSTGAMLVLMPRRGPLSAETVRLAVPTQIRIRPLSACSVWLGMCLSQALSNAYRVSWALLTRTVTQALRVSRALSESMLL